MNCGYMLMNIFPIKSHVWRCWIRTKKCECSVWIEGSSWQIASHWNISCGVSILRLFLTASQRSGNPETLFEAGSRHKENFHLLYGCIKKEHFTVWTTTIRFLQDFFLLWFIRVHSNNLEYCEYFHFCIPRQGNSKCHLVGDIRTLKMGCTKFTISFLAKVYSSTIICQIHHSYEINDINNNHSL